MVAESESTEKGASFTTMKAKQTPYLALRKKYGVCIDVKREFYDCQGLTNSITSAADIANNINEHMYKRILDFFKHVCPTRLQKELAKRWTICSMLDAPDDKKKQ